MIPVYTTRYVLPLGGGAQRRKPAPRREMAPVPDGRCFVITMTDTISLFLYVSPACVLCCLTFLSFIWTGSTAVKFGSVITQDPPLPHHEYEQTNKKAMMPNTLEKCKYPFNISIQTF